MISPKDPYNAVANEVTAGPGGGEKSAAQDAGAGSIDKVPTSSLEPSCANSTAGSPASRSAC